MPSTSRLDRLDTLRGLAMLWMAGFHFSFDLNQFHWLQPAQDFYDDPFWTLQRSCIVGVFLFCVGLSQAAAGTRGVSNRRFLKRWTQIAIGALLVSLGSAWMFPASWISCGVLHGIALMLIVLRLLERLRIWPLLLLAALAMVLPVVVQHPVFDSRWLNWVGLVTRKPITEDYVPLLPWLGVGLLGLCAGRWLLARNALLPGGIPAWLGPVSRFGRWPLSFYLLHQPILLGVLALCARFRYI
jgi:uncharacterized membrane protein